MKGIDRTARAGAIALAVLAAMAVPAFGQDITISDPDKLLEAEAPAVAELVSGEDTVPVDDTVPTETVGLPDYNVLLGSLEQNVSDAQDDGGGGGAGSPISVSRTGGSASAYVGFASKTRFYISQLRITDTACDSHSVFVQIRVYNGSGWGNSATYDTEGYRCHNTISPKVANPNYGSNVKRVGLRLCVNKTWGNDCTSGSSVPNPYNP